MPIVNGINRNLPLANLIFPNLSQGNLTPLVEQMMSIILIDNNGFLIIF